MDNLTHAALGVCAGLAARRAGAPVAPAALAALLAAEAPDLDVLIRSANDPLVAFRWHRHFTHSFAFLPVFMFLAAWLAAWIFRGKHETSTHQLLLPAAAGGLSHLLCDACTSYGTMLLWPFSDARIAWDCLPIVDVAVTLPLVILALRAWKTHRHALAYAGLGWFVLYAGVGRIQHNRAEAALYTWSKDLPVSRLAAKPTISNLILWRGIWLEGDVWHVGAVRVPLWGPIQVLERENRWRGHLRPRARRMQARPMGLSSRTSVDSPEAGTASSRAPTAHWSSATSASRSYPTAPRRFGPCDCKVPTTPR